MSESRLAKVVDIPTSTTFAPVGDSTVVWRVESLEADYRRIRDEAAVFDHSGAGLVELTGAGAEEVLDESFTRDVAYMTPERTLMGLVLGDEGEPIDVLTVFRTDDGFVLQTSTGRGSDVRDVFAKRANGRAEVGDAAQRLVAVGIEGPLSVELLRDVLPEPVEGLPFQSARVITWEGKDVTISRTGLTGEFGFTFLVSWQDVKVVWEALTSIAAVAGLEALETAMIEVRQPLLHRELLDGDTVTTAGLNWLVDVQKEAFVGKEQVLADFEAGPAFRRLSVTSAERLESGSRVFFEGEDIGEVAYAVPSPSLGFCGIARVSAEFAAAGLDLTIGSAAGTAARSVASPMRIPTSWQGLQG